MDIILIQSSFISTKILDFTFPVVIAGGKDSGANIENIVEVVDNNTNCNADRTPTKLTGGEGISGMICGGQDHDLNVLSSCWHLNPSGRWTAGENMLESRAYFTMTAVEEDVFVIGGRRSNFDFLKSVETYSLRKYEGWSNIKDAPIEISMHCTVKLNTSYLMVIGGYSSEVIQTTVCVIIPQN